MDDNNATCSCESGKLTTEETMEWLKQHGYSMPSFATDREIRSAYNTVKTVGEMREWLRKHGYSTPSFITDREIRSVYNTMKVMMEGTYS